MSSPSNEEVLQFFMDVLDRGSDMFGELKPAQRARLFAVVDNPNQETWDDAHSIILSSKSDRVVTLWQALLMHTDFDVTRGPIIGRPWPKLPTPEQLLIAIRTQLY